MNAARRITSRVRFSASKILAGGANRVLLVFAALTVAGISWPYFAVYRQPSPGRRRSLTIALGIAATLLLLLTAALSARKRLAYQGVGRLSVWMSMHIYSGVVAAFAVLLHSGFSPTSPLPALLLAFFWLTAVSGVWGWWISKKIPPLLTAIEESPAIIEDILSVRAECLHGMLELAQGGSADFAALVNRHLIGETASWARMLRFYRHRTTFAEEIPAFQKDLEPLLRRLGPHENHAFQRAAEYALRVNKMNAELFLHRIMRGWLTLHITATATMFGLLAVHIFSALYY